jgi:hypothetical protein
MMRAPLDEGGITLALIEAQVGSLVEVLPVAVLVTSPFGEIYRANQAAVDLLHHPVPLVGQLVSRVLELAQRKRALNVGLRWLRHEGEILRLYVIHEAS